MKVSIIFDSKTTGDISLLHTTHSFIQQEQFDLDVEHNGFFLINFTPETDCTIKDIKIDGDSVRELIYLGYKDHNGDKIQPCTDIKAGDKWCYPCMLPLSSFINFVKSKFRNGHIGNNLSEYFNVYMPESIKINDLFPKVLKDYFEFNGSFEVIDKNDNIKWFSGGCVLPYQPCNLKYPKEEMSEEFLNNFNDIDWSESISHQVNINKEEYGLDDNKTWKKFELFRDDETVSWKDKCKVDLTKWPVLSDFLENVPNENILSGLLMELPSGGFIYPHNDSTKEHWGYGENVERLYIPLLGNDEDVYFKFGDFGCIDLSKINFINNAKYPHAVINQSKNNRFVLSIKLKSNYNDWEKYL